MKPGRDLDVLVETKVMNAAVELHIFKELGSEKRTKIPITRGGVVPAYSTDRALMFEVLDRVKDLGFSTRLRFTEAMKETMSGKVTGGYLVCPTNWWFVVKPEDICLAALKAVGHDIQAQPKEKSNE